MKNNEFRFIGRVGKVEIRYSGATGNPITTINLGAKRNKTEYDNFNIKFFNSEDTKLAEKVAEDVKEGDYIGVEGRVKTSLYTPEGSDKKRKAYEFIGNSFFYVEFDEASKEWVRC